MIESINKIFVNVNKYINLIDEAIPVYKKAKPIYSNIKNMYNSFNVIKKEQIKEELNKIKSFERPKNYKSSEIHKNINLNLDTLSFFK